MLCAAAALLALSALQAQPGSVDPCTAAAARLGARAVQAAGPSLPDIEAYRGAWRAACDPARPAADLSRLISDAEALVSDVRLGAAAAAVAGTVGPGEPWPLPALRREGEGVLVDWAVFARASERGTAEDRRFFRAFSAATDGKGAPSWLGDPPPEGGARCVRLAEARWDELARAVEQMEASGGRSPYADRARELRGAFLETLTALARGGSVCGCLRGDPAARLAPLAAVAGERLGTPTHRELARAAVAALSALQAGRAQVSWLRESPGAPATGCAAGAAGGGAP